MNNKKADLFNKYKQVGAQFFVFAAGGVVNFLLNIGLTYLLTEVFDIYYLLSFAIVQIIVIIYGFVYNTFLTFRLKKASTWIFVKFITFLHIFALVNILLVRFFTDVVGLQYLISIIITIFATIILRFFLYKKYVFVEDNSSTKKIILANYPMIILGVALFIVLLFIYGFIPGLYLNDLSAHYLMAANTDCILNHGVFNLSPCFNYGYPHGYPFLIGLPLIYVSAAISRIFSVSSYLSNVIAGIIVLVVSNLSIIALFKKFKIKTWLAVIFAFIWLASTILYKQTGYIYVMYGFILLPFYILINYLFFTTSQTTKKQLITWSLILLLVRVFAMFTDGYSFIISLLASGFLWLAFVIKEYKNTKKVIYYTIIIGIANLIPVFLYKIYTDMLGNFSVMPIDFFRAQGVDLISLFVPSNAYWWADLLNVGPIWGDSQVAYSFFGDGSNFFLSYLGISLFVIFILYLFSKNKKNVYLTFLTIAGVIALVLSFGPSIKMSDTRPKQTKNSFYLSDYLMTTDDTAIDMPYEFIYQKIPGISNMRAIHRWLLLFKFILIIAAAVYLSQLYKKYPKISVILTLIIFIEIFPNLRQTHNIYRQNYTNLQQFRHDVIEPLKAYINPGQTIFYLAPENTADWENDYLANYISANLNIHSYNCGGDKNMAIARSHWPEKILSMRDYENQNDDAFQALQNNDVDKIIIPNFSLRWDAYSWPPSPESYQQTLLDREAVFDYNDERFNIIFKKYFSIIDLKN